MYRNWKLAILGLVALLTATPAWARQIEVGGAGNTCTLAAAITAANTDSASGGCIAGAGADTIMLKTSVSLSQALPPLTSTLTIDGNYFLVDGNNAQRLFLVNAASADVIFKDITLRNGRAHSASDGGGGLRVAAGKVRLQYSYLMNNSNPGGNGGGLYISGGAVKLVGSIVMNNSAAAAGGSLDIDNSTLQENSADWFQVDYHGAPGWISADYVLPRGTCD